MKIVRDSREQSPFHFDDEKFGKVDVQESSLPTGDYSLVGLESRVAVERKSLPDFMASISTGRERFERELARARGLDAFMVVVEAPFSEIVAGNYRGRSNPKQQHRRPIASCVDTGPLSTSHNREPGLSTQPFISCVTTPDKLNENTKRPSDNRKERKCLWY